MDLIIGGAYQGKLTLAAQEYGLTPGDICDLAAGEPVLGARCYIHLEELTRRQEDTEPYLPLLAAAEVVDSRKWSSHGRSAAAWSPWTPESGPGGSAMAVCCGGWPSRPAACAGYFAD